VFPVTVARLSADSPAKLDRMSWRTAPVWSSTFAPLEPSPGDGPAVSSQILLHAPPAPVSAPGVLLVMSASAPPAAEQGERASAEAMTKEVAATDRGSRGGEMLAPATRQSTWTIHGSHVRHMTCGIPYGAALERCVRWRAPCT